VELVAPATNPPVAFLAPAGAVEIVSREIIGVVTSGMYGPQL
jgi:hypothetical protein